MAEGTPVQVAQEVAKAGAQAPAEAATAPLVPQESAAEAKEAEVAWTPESLLPDVRAKAKAFIAAEAERYHLGKVGEHGGWMRDMPSESREKIKRDPFYVDRLETQLVELRQMVGGAGVSGKGGQAPDQLDVITSELQAEFGLDEINSKLSRRIIEKAVKEAQRQLSGPLVERTKGEIRGETLNEKFAIVQISPEWQDASEQGQIFRERFLGRMAMRGDAGKREDPIAVFENLKSLMFGKSNGSPPALKPKLSMGDAPTGGLKPPVNAPADAVERFNTALRANGSDPRSW